MNATNTALATNLDDFFFFTGSGGGIGVGRVTIPGSEGLGGVGIQIVSLGGFTDNLRAGGPTHLWFSGKRWMEQKVLPHRWHQ